MALTISFSGTFDNGSRAQYKKWEETFHLPFAPLSLARAASVDVVTADGDELQHLHAAFEGLPFPKPLTGHTVAHWFGETAKFIAANLR